MSKYIYSFVLCFVITTLSSYAQTTIFDDDFEDTTLGDAVTATLNSGISTGSWVGGNIGADRLIIADDVISAGNRALTFSDVNAWSDSAYAQAHVTEDTALSFGIDITFKGTSQNPQKVATGGRISGYDSSGNELFRLAFRQDSDEPSEWTYADIDYWDGASYDNTVANNVEFRPGSTEKWIDFEINLDADGLDFWVDADDDGNKDAGEYVEDVAYLNGQTGTDKLDYVQFWGEGANAKAEKNWYDDILVEKAATPAAPSGSVFRFQ